MSSMNLMEYGPLHADHRRVPWPDDMIDLKISLPAPFHSLRHAMRFIPLKKSMGSKDPGTKSKPNLQKTWSKYACSRGNWSVNVNPPSSIIGVFFSIQQLVVSNTWGIHWGFEATFPLITKLSTITDLTIICSDSYAEQFLEFIEKPADISSAFALPNLLNLHL
ncbi:hypothetical protein BJ165DRAFT_1528889 [Panaeolus papilionaceus]|nr:hypothetical protein BJ165DRAFT_1528889 [Panaeolus papilionaceus]